MQYITGQGPNARTADPRNDPIFLDQHLVPTEALQIFWISL